MRDLIFDVMLNGRYVCTLAYPFCPLFTLTQKELEEFVEKKRPTLSGKNYNIIFCNRDDKNYIHKTATL